ncbi:hypothetical protein HYZ41_01770 [archaeon]|nr:hypothetical protein [archaeon]
MTIIEKVNEKDTSKVMKILDGFHPVACRECKNRKGFDLKLFLLSKGSDNVKEMQLIRKSIERYGVQDFGVYNTGRRSIIVAALCNNCKSDHVIWDYCDDCEWVKKQLRK